MTTPAVPPTLATMTTESPDGDPREWIARLEERMETVRAENETLRADLAATLAGMRMDMATHREDAARRDVDAAKRETRLIFAMIAIVGIGLTIFGFVTA